MCGTAFVTNIYFCPPSDRRLLRQQVNILTRNTIFIFTMSWIVYLLPKQINTACETKDAYLHHWHQQPNRSEQQPALTVTSTMYPSIMENEEHRWHMQKIAKVKMTCSLEHTIKHLLMTLQWSPLTGEQWAKNVIRSLGQHKKVKSKLFGDDYIILSSHWAWLRAATLAE